MAKTTLRIGMPLWDLRTGDRFTYCGPANCGRLWVKNASGARPIGRQYLSRGPRTAERKGK